MLGEDGRLEAEHRRHLRQRVLTIVGDDREIASDLEFQIVEAITGAGADPVDLLGGQLRGTAADAGRSDLAGAVVEVETDDVGLSSGDPEHRRARRRRS